VAVGGEVLEHEEDAATSHVGWALAGPAAAHAKDEAAAAVVAALLGAHTHAVRSVTAPVTAGSRARLAEWARGDKGAFVRSVGAFATSYSDAGFLGVRGVVPSQAAGAFLDATIGAFKEVAAGRVSDEELRRAKAGVKVERLAHDDAVSVRDALAAAALARPGSKPEGAAAAAAAVDGVTAADVARVAAAALKSQPALAVVGDLSFAPRYDAFVAKFK
jgi:predicted Zn-dependent peptidase